MTNEKRQITKFARYPSSSSYSQISDAIDKVVSEDTDSTIIVLDFTQISERRSTANLHDETKPASLALWQKGVKAWIDSSGSLK